jgi:hypothetical protein
MSIAVAHFYYQYQCMRVAFYLYPWKHLFFFVFLMIAVLTEERCNHSVLVLCIYVIAKNADVFSTYLLAIVLHLRAIRSIYLPIFDWIVCSFSS